MGRGKSRLQEAGRRFASLRSPRAASLERAGVDAAVDEEILPGDVARLRAAQVGAQVAELLGRAEAARGNRLLEVPLDLFHAQAFFLRVELRIALQAVGPESAREDVVDGDVGGHGLACQSRDEAGEAAARAVGERELGDRRLYRARCDVDDAPKAPR